MFYCVFYCGLMCLLWLMFSIFLIKYSKFNKNQICSFFPNSTAPTMAVRNNTDDISNGNK